MKLNYIIIAIVLFIICLYIIYVNMSPSFTTDNFILDYDKGVTRNTMNFITDYGVVGDGVTDNTIIFQKAVNMLQGKTISIPSGVYLISSAITIPSNTTILGAGINNTVIKLKDNITGDIDSMIKTPNDSSDRSKDIYIKNIKFIPTVYSYIILAKILPSYILISQF